MPLHSDLVIYVYKFDLGKQLLNLTSVFSAVQEHAALWLTVNDSRLPSNPAEQSSATVTFF